MLINVWKVNELTILDATRVTPENVKKALLASNGGTVFVVWQDNTLIGCFNIDIFQQWDGKSDVTKYCNTKYPVIDENEEYKEQFGYIISKNIYAGMIPIIDSNRKLKGAVSGIDDTWLYDRERALDYLYFLKRNEIDMNAFFIKNNYKKIAFWGINKVSLSMASDLNSFDDIEVVGIFDNVATKIKCCENILNYEVNIYYVKSLEELSRENIDLIIISDWRFRHLSNVGGVKCLYFNVLLGNDFKKVIAWSLKQKLNHNGVEVFSVRIPTQEDLCIPKKKEMNLVERLNWFAKETGLEAQSDEMRIFNDERHALCENVIKDQKICFFGDMKGKYFNFIQKHRIVLNNPNEYSNTIYLIGPCIVMGLYNKDTCTLGFFLQEKLNEKTSYRTVPIGIPNDADRYYSFQMIKSLNLKQGDKIYWIEQSFKMENFDIDMTSVFMKAYELLGDNFYYDSPVHCGKYVQKECANLLYNHIMKCDNEAKTVISNIENNTNSNNNIPKNFAGNIELEKFKEYIKTQAIHTKQMIGAIVMNCNPFTLGHQYLIEHAASEVDYLYIFVVEEDKSFFKFEDRIALVKSGTEYLKNVKVLPSGEFIISSNTFSEYFDKANLKGTVVDTSLDVETFAQHIAPTLDISVRFVGEEPLDPITNQYNQSMREILPKYGIELREIRRKEMGDKVISASRVRKCLEEKKWDEIAKLVPKTTYDFLIEKYS